MSQTATAMESEREQRVAAARAEIDKEDKVKIAKAEKDAKAERARVQKATAERKAKEAAKPAAPARKRPAKPEAKERVTDAELLAAVRKVLAKDAELSKSGAVKAVRASGVSAAGKRIRNAYAEAIKSRQKSKAKKAKGAAAKVRKQEAALGINH